MYEPTNKMIPPSSIAAQWACWKITTWIFKDGATDLSSRHGQQEDTLLCKYVLVYFTLKT